MHKILLLLVFCSGLIKAQDTLVGKDNTRTPVKITEVNEENIFYKRSENPDGPTYSVRKVNVSYVVYANGFKESFTQVNDQNNGQYQPTQPDVVQPTKPPASNNSPDYMMKKGASDARVYYRNPGGSIGVFCASYGCGILGLIPAITVSMSEPKEKNLGYPNVELWNNQSYREGYRREAHRIKKKRVWTGFGIGFAAAVVTVAILQN